MGPEGWLGKLGDRPLDDAILVSIRNSSYTILFKKEDLFERIIQKSNNKNESHFINLKWLS